MPLRFDRLPQKLRTGLRVFRPLWLVSTLFLSALLLLQLVVLIIGFFDLSDLAIQHLKDRLHEEGFDADYEKIRAGFPDSLVISDATIYLAKTGERLATVEAAEVQFSPFAWLKGGSPIAGVALAGIDLFCPPSHSPNGTEEKIAIDADFLVERRLKGWRIESLKAELGNLFVSASGDLPDLPRMPKKPTDWLGEIEKNLPSAVRALDFLRQTENPHLDLQFSRSEEGHLEVAAELSSERINASPDLIVQEPVLKTKWNYDGFSWTGKSGTLRASEITWQDEVTARGFKGNLFWNPDAKNWMPASAKLDVHDIVAEPGTLKDIQLEVTVRDELQFEGDFFAYFNEGPIDLHLHLDGKTGDGEASFRAQVNPTPVLQHEFARQLGLKRDLFFRTPIFATGEANFKNWDFLNGTASARAHTGTAEIDGVLFDRARAEGNFSRDFIDVPSLFIAAEDFEVDAVYEFDLTTRDYRFLFNGTLRPLHITSWFEDWWIHLWEGVDLTGPPVKGDIDLHSVLGRSEETRLTGSAYAEDFFLRSVPFKEARLKLFALQDYADIFDLEIEREEGSATGSLRYWGDPDGSGFGKVAFNIESTIDPGDVAQLFDSTGRGILSSFRFSEPPQLSIGGMIYDWPREDQTRVIFSGRTSAPVEYENVPLDSLYAEGHVIGNDLILPVLEGGFAGGSFKARAEKWADDAGEYLEFGAHFTDADLTRAIESAKRWQAWSGFGDNDEVPGAKIGGLFDLDIELSGHYGDFTSFSGDGFLQVREADLAEVHLLGVLSRLLSVTPLGFTSLQFDEAFAAFQVEKENLHVSELKLTSSTSSISGSGDYSLTDDDLNFLIKLHFMRESKIPFLSLLLRPVLDPIARVMEVRLSGSLDDPQWRFLLGPRNILSNLSNRSEQDQEDEEAPESP